MMDEEILVSLGLFATAIACVWLFNHFKLKKHHIAHETIRHAITNGQPIPSELIEKVSQISDPVRADMRRGILLIAFGIALLILGLIIAIEEQESIKPILGLASFPIILGLTYLGLWKFSRDRPSN